MHWTAGGMMTTGGVFVQPGLLGPQAFYMHQQPPPQEMQIGLTAQYGQYGQYGHGQYGQQPGANWNGNKLQEAAVTAATANEEDGGDVMDEEKSVKRPAIPLMDPKEVEEWIAQRKRNYPTEEKIAKKEAEKAAKQADKPGKAENGGKRKRGRGKKDDGKKAKRGKVENAEKDCAAVANQPKGGAEDEATNGKAEVQCDDRSVQKDSGDLPTVQTEVGPSEAQATKADAIDSDASSSNAEADAGDNKLQSKKGSKVTPCRLFARGLCRRGDKCWFSHDPTIVRQPSASQSHADPRSMTGKIAAHAGKNLEPHVQRKTVLNELLKPQIEREQAVILQCIRHIMRNTHIFKGPG
ncbi:hypothetical protein HK101_011228 [Irineochytrium annulatum]|nr:hypothetical protein HK101_011228 [Irineochytrium annulatum]